MCLYMSTKKSKFGKIKKNTKEHQENICIIFFTFLALYLIRLQVVGAVVLIHPVYIIVINLLNKETFLFVSYFLCW
jgi:hypothetical protein